MAEFNASQFSFPQPETFPSGDDAPVYISNTRAFMNRLKGGPVDSLLGKVGTGLAATINRFIDNESPMSDDEIDNINKDNPGLNVPRGTKPRNVAMYLSDYKAEQKRQAQLAAAKPGLTSEFMQGAGSLIGNIGMTVPELAIAADAPELFGLESAATDAAIGTKLASYAQRGALEGLTYGGLQEVGSVSEAAATNHPYNQLQGMANIALNGLWGGAILTGGGAIFGKLRDAMPTKFKNFI